MWIWFYGMQKKLGYIGAGFQTTGTRVRDTIFSKEVLLTKLAILHSALSGKMSIFIDRSYQIGMPSLEMISTSILKEIFGNDGSPGHGKCRFH